MKNNYLLTFGLMLLCSIGFAQDRVSLCETFTSSTCPPCAPGNVQLESILNAPGNENNHAAINYQMSWPGAGDPYYTDEGNTKRSYYGVSGIPDTHLDGGVGFNPNGFSQSQLDAVTGVAPKCEIVALYQVNTGTQTVDIQIEVIALEDIPGGTFLQCAIIEHITDNNTGGNGETEFHHVMKKFVPGTGGTLIPSSTDAGDTVNVNLSYTFNGSYVLPPDAGSPIDHSVEHSVEEFTDLGIVAWVQRITSKEVFQATNGVNSAVGIDENASTIPTAKIYPNPATDNVAIAFHNSVDQDVTINIVNTFGQVVYTNELKNVPAGRTVEEVNTENFTSGIYVINISSANGQVSKKLSIR